MIARLAVLAAVTLAVSASWMVIVDRWPASDRPYIGGSTDNTVLDLAFGYNGFGRVDGDSQGAGGGGACRETSASRTAAAAIQRRANGASRVPNGGGTSPRRRTAGERRGAAERGAERAGASGGRAASSAGRRAWLRMFDDANGSQIGWLLPFAIGGGLMALWSSRRDRRGARFAVLFLGWIALYGGVFSYAQGIFHSYYTSAMAPGVAALAGIGPSR